MIMSSDSSSLKGRPKILLDDRPGELGSKLSRAADDNIRYLFIGPQRYTKSIRWYINKDYSYMRKRGVPWLKFVPRGTIPEDLKLLVLTIIRIQRIRVSERCR